MNSCRVVMAVIAALALALGARDHASAQGAGGAAKTGSATCARPSFRVVLDVGHTVEAPGAKSARGQYEYDFNLRLAKLIQRNLLDAGFEKTTLLITHGKSRKQLFERVAHASKASADLFLSIHHDSVPDKFLEKWQFEGEQREFSDRFKGHSIFVARDNGDYSGSLQFARLLGNQLKTRGLRYTPHYTEKFMGRRQRQLVDAEAGVYRYDQLVVLKSTRIPAALLEAGSIINRDEELALATPDRQSLISAAVRDAVESFCAVRRPHTEDRIAGKPAAASPSRTAHAKAQR